MHIRSQQAKKTCNKMKYYYLIIGILFINLSCKAQSKNSQALVEKPAIEYLIQNIENSKNNQIIVVAHRGDWRNAPENSLKSIQNCIDMGVDMVEIDLKQTKDKHLVLMHDMTIDRTTNGKGRVKDFTLDSLKTFKLLDSEGMSTAYEIPTLEEALLLAKDEILVNLDHSYDIFDECYSIIKKTNTLNQVVVKGVKTRTKVEKEFGNYLDEVYFMPIVVLTNPKSQNVVDDYLENRVPIAFEFIIPTDTFKLIGQFDEIRAKGASIWVNALRSYQSAGHDDEKAVIDTSVYDWYIENNIDIIQTDRPQLLINYLRSKGLHK